MTARATLLVDAAVGETRRALVDGEGRAFRLDVDRWSERGRRAKVDEIWWGRVKARLPGETGWFVDLGLDQHGVLETSKPKAVHEGLLTALRVKAEAFAGKGPQLRLADLSPAESRAERPGFRAAPANDPFLAGVTVEATVDGLNARRAIDDALGEAASPLAPLPGGGELAIEGTRALTAIDIDAGGRLGGGAVGFALALNRAAADEAARQIALRAVGGLIVVDFLSMRDRADQLSVAAGFRAALASRLGRASIVAEISQLGLCEVSVARRARPIADARGPEPEREALDALRAIETEAIVARGARIGARVTHAAAAWLDEDAISWKAALAARIGERWRIETADRPAPSPDVWILR